MLALEVPVHHGARVQGGGRLQLHLQHVARRRRPQRRDADPVPVGRPGGGAPGKKLRDLGHNASVFYAIWVMMHPFFMFWVIMHQYFTRFGSFCISFLRDLGHNASVFYAILVIMHQFLRRDARSASSSVPSRRNREKIDKK